MSTTSLLYEQIVDHDTVPKVGFLIEMSEFCRANKMEEYADALEKLMGHLRRPNARLQKQPLFEWAGMESPCFRFELHKTLHLVHDDHLTTASTQFAEADYEQASKSFVATAKVALRMVDNLKKWTAISPEVRRAPPFHVEYLLSLVAKSKCRAHHCLFTKGYADDDSGVETWKHGHVQGNMKKILQHGEAAVRYCTAAALLWPRETAQGRMTTVPGEFETKLLQAYHRTASYCAPNFQDRLDHAALCADEFEDCRQVLELNDRLYYLKANVLPPPSLLPLKCLLSAS